MKYIAFAFVPRGEETSRTMRWSDVLSGQISKACELSRNSLAVFASNYGGPTTPKSVMRKAEEFVEAGGLKVPVHLFHTSSDIRNCIHTYEHQADVLVFFANRDERAVWEILDFISKATIFFGHVEHGYMWDNLTEKLRSSEYHGLVIPAKDLPGRPIEFLPTPGAATK